MRIFLVAVSFGLVGCSSTPVTKEPAPTREVAATPTSPDVLESGVIKPLITAVTTFSCSNVVNFAGNDADDALLREGLTGLVRDPRRLTYLNQKFKAINPAYKLVEIPADDVPMAIRSRSSTAANFKLSLGKRWVLFVVQEAPNLFCRDSNY